MLRVDVAGGGCYTASNDGRLAVTEDVSAEPAFGGRLSSYAEKCESGQSELSGIVTEKVVPNLSEDVNVAFPPR